MIEPLFEEPFDESWDLERKVTWLANSMVGFRKAVSMVMTSTNKRVHQTSLRLLLLSVIVVLDLASTTGFALLLTGAQSACHEANQTREATRNLWRHILVISPPAKTSQQEQVSKQFILYVDQQYAPRDCSLLNQL